MRVRSLLAAAAAVAALTLPLSAATAQRRSEGVRGDGPSQVDWRTTTARTPEGGFVMGNPNARVKLIEYFSLTCPHCAAFAGEGGERLFGDYVRRGVVSVEYRNFVLNGFDMAATMLTRCASPRGYFEMTHYLLANQPRWMGPMQTLTEAQRNELRAATPLVAMQRIAAWLHLGTIATRNGGLNAAQIQACLADQRNLDQIAAVQRLGSGTHNVTGTPTFVVNGTVASGNTWAAIEPLLRGR